MQLFSVCRIRSSCEIHLQKITASILKLARTYAKFCEKHNGVVEFEIGWVAVDGWMIFEIY
jgi:hypothetical protein